MNFSCLIISNNSYLKLALTWQLQRWPVKQKTIFVDVNSFERLIKMVLDLNEAGVSNDDRICFIGRSCTNFLILSPFNPVSLRQPMYRLKSAFLQGILPRYSEVKKLITSHQKLSMMSLRQQMCLDALKKYGEIERASSLTGLPKKTFYSIIRTAGFKLNLQSLRQLREFIINEVY